MRKITTKFYTKVAIVATLLLNSAAASAEDDYKTQIDNSFSEYIGAQVDDTRCMWIKSKWIRSYDLGNWTEDVGTIIKDASTLYVRNKIIYVHGTYDGTTEKCTFFRFDTVTGEELDPIEIDFSQAKYKPEKGYIALREDDAGTAYLISACDVASSAIISFHTIDLDNCGIINSYITDAKSIQTDNYDSKLICYPVVVGDIEKGNYSVYSINSNSVNESGTTVVTTYLLKVVYKNHNLESSIRYLFDGNKSFSSDTKIVYINDSDIIIDSGNTNPTYYKYDGVNYKTTSTTPLTQDQSKAIGVCFFEHSDIKMVAYSPIYKKNTPHIYRIISIQNDNLSEWMHRDSYNVKMWDIANLATLSDFTLVIARNTLAYPVNNGANTDLYVYTSGLGLAAYNIIGPGTTTEEDIVECESSYSIDNNIITTNKPCDIVVYNIHGDEVRSVTSVSSLSLSDLCKGIYIVKMSSNTRAIKVAVR